MSYILTSKTTKNTASVWVRMSDGLSTFLVYLKGEEWRLVVIAIAVLLNSGSAVVTPYIISYAIDNYIITNNLGGLARLIAVLIVIYIISVFAGYLQSRIMGRLSQRTLFRLRQNLFSKIQSLPLAFFNQNKSGDLISRLNNDTDKLNQFLSESLLRFVSSFFSLVGIGIFIFFLNTQMAFVLLFSCIFIAIFNSLVSRYAEKANKLALETEGNLSAEVNESLANYKALVAFGKQEYFLQKFAEINETNYRATTKAQIFSGLFRPWYDLVGNIAQIIVLSFGIYLISKGQLTTGLLIGFLAYAQKFYEPLRILGSIWGSLQSALAAWLRVREIFSLENNLKIIK